MNVLVRSRVGSASEERARVGRLGQVGGQLAVSHSAPRRLTTIAYNERLFDIALITVLLPVVLLMSVVIAIAIRIDSPGPIIYRSRRIGRNGAPFQMLKFRKMWRDAAGDPLTLDRDERFTPIGRFLAATRLDELPQAWNVLRGNMRLVGPRPELGYFVNEFPDQYAEILSVIPGITGVAQLRFLDEKRLLVGPDPNGAYREHILPVKLEIDVRYARTHSMRGDVRIIAQTALLPIALLAVRLRTRSSAPRHWMPTAAITLMLALSFVVVSSQMP